LGAHADDHLPLRLDADLDCRRADRRAVAQAVPEGAAMKIYLAGHRRTAIDSCPVTASDAQIAWMAALYEGEGYVAAPRRRSEGASSPLRLRFKMCDRDVLVRFQQFAGGGNLSGPHKPSGLGKKDTFTLSIQGARAYALLAAFGPWLGMRRGEQVRVAIEKWEFLRPTTDGTFINKSDAVEIKRRLATGGHGIGRVLAREYGISDAMISRIKKGRAWTCASI
jgi:hypothetical protein